MTNIEDIDDYVNHRKAELLINAACGSHKITSNKPVRVQFYIDDPKNSNGRVVKLVAPSLDHSGAIELLATIIGQTDEDEELGFTTFYKTAAGSKAAYARMTADEKRQFTVVSNTDASEEAIGNNECGKFTIVE